MTDQEEELVQAKKNGKISIESDDKPVKKHETSYFEALVHLFKAGIGSGCFAMGEAIGNTGIVLGLCLTIFLSIICLYEQHVLVKCSSDMRRHFNLEKSPDYAMTFELSLRANKKWKQHSVLMRRIVNLCLILTRILFCLRIVYWKQRPERVNLFWVGIQPSIRNIVCISSNHTPGADNQSQVSG